MHYRIINDEILEFRFIQLTPQYDLLEVQILRTGAINNVEMVSRILKLGKTRVVNFKCTQFVEKLIKISYRKNVASLT